MSAICLFLELLRWENTTRPGAILRIGQIDAVQTWTTFLSGMAMDASTVKETEQLQNHRSVGQVLVGDPTLLCTCPSICTSSIEMDMLN